VLKGLDADENAFKLYAPGSRILHLATHGFLIPPECGGRSASAGGDFSSAGDVMESPLIHSGLVLAGANRHGPDPITGEDGVLTAEEVSAQDLSGVEWAVLSACDTGQGAESRDEGVVGLRRAFHVAGVRTLITSLWPVDDATAESWMHDLYVARLTEHLDTAEAVRSAQLQAIHRLRGEGRSTHPAHWASFVATGSWH
jgi:CHAT domain-containing protein